MWRNQFLLALHPDPRGGMEKTMSDVTLFGFPRSTQIAGLVLTQKEVPYGFQISKRR